MVKAYSKKIILLGEGAVGKTSLMRKFVDGHFDDEYISTIGTVTKKRWINLPEADLEFIIWDMSGQSLKSTLNMMHYSGANGVIAVFDATRRDTICYEAESEKLIGLHQYITDVRVVAGNVPIVLLGNKYDLIRNFGEYSKRDVAEVKKGDRLAKLEFDTWMRMKNHRIIDYYKKHYPVDFQNLQFSPVLEEDLPNQARLLKDNLKINYDIPCFISSAKTGENVADAFNTLGELILAELKKKEGASG